MFAPATAQILIFSIISVSVALMLIRPHGIAEVYWVGGGVILLLGLRLIDPPLAWHASSKATDVCLFLIGMMLLCEMARVHGVFDWISALAVRRAGGSGLKLFTMVYAVGAVVTILMSNDATAVVLTPAILTAVRRAKVQPLPYLFVCAFIANAASFLLPISNPANLVVFHGAMPPLARWLTAFGIPCLLSIAITYCALRWIYRKDLGASIDCTLDAVDLNRNGAVVLAGTGAMMAVLLAASSLGKDLGLPTCLCALAILAVICIKEQSNPLRFAREISWATLLLVVGLFILVDAAERAGAMQWTEKALSWSQQMGATTDQLITGFGVGVANNFVNNLPLGLIVGHAVHVAHSSSPITDAALIGVDLGPNLSITGSLATILWLLALRKEAIKVSFWDFLKVGIIAMPLALLGALGGSILLHAFLLGS
jgi:arsenical pump membrane protein